MVVESPSLYGLKKTNRDFTKKDAWGKNQFNSSFPASLCCYLESKKIDPVYLSIKGGNFLQSTISVQDVFGISANSNDTYFAFETQHTPFQKYVIGVYTKN